MGGAVLCHSLVVHIPAVPLTASRLKWGLVPIDIMMTSALILTRLYNIIIPIYIRAIRPTPLKVIKVGINQKPISDFLLLFNSN